jgi:hypothetical protein
MIFKPEQWGGLGPNLAVAPEKTENLVTKINQFLIFCELKAVIFASKIIMLHINSIISDSGNSNNTNTSNIVQF